MPSLSEEMYVLTSSLAQSTLLVAVVGQLFRGRCRVKYDGGQTLSYPTFLVLSIRSPFLFALYSTIAIVLVRGNQTPIPKLVTPRSVGHQDIGLPVSLTVVITD